MTVWFDVEDLIRFFQSAKRPTGIQRFSFEVCAATAHLAGQTNDIGFCRRNELGTRLLRVDFAALEASIRASSEHILQPPAAIAAAPPAAPPTPSRLFTLARSLPPAYRLPLGEIYRSGLASARATKTLAKACLAALRPAPVPDSSPAPRLPAETASLPLSLQPGDWLVNLGASWERPYTRAFLDHLDKSGIRLGLFAHDMIPDLFPEWCTHSMVQDFSDWLEDTVPRASQVFAISNHTLKDLEFCLKRRNRPVPPYALLPPGGNGTAPTAKLPRPLPQPYILMVGTIEARKNHGGMLRVWRRLLNDPPANGVPCLVFAGKAGWLTSDLMQQLENARHLDGKILFVDQPSETQLAALYQHCLFTLYPSLYEGWGLPVTESLCFGKPVAASSSSAIPEAGGSFCCYFDPDNLTDAYTKIRTWIEQPEQPAAAAARIAQHFTPPRWTDTARSLLHDCTAARPASAPMRASKIAGEHNPPQHAGGG
ncbi:glycosyltransferase family 4 protein [Acidocella sp.]|uniref:glycosyltransferase family 4 protein n=1 Tax=Acidocella sp. TaxID=50710 RepID=UPI003CFEE1CD